MNRRTFRALVDDGAFDITLEGDRVTLDGTPMAYTFDPVGDNAFLLLVERRSVPVVVSPVSEGRLRVTIDGQSQEVRVQDEHDLLLERFGLAEAADAAEREVRAPMPGLVLRIMVTEGQAVEQGDALLVLEAMKMENELRAPADGVVHTLHVATQDAVDKDALLIEIHPEDG